MLPAVPTATGMLFCACVLPLLGKPATLALAPSRALAALEPFAQFYAAALCPKCGRVGDSKSNCCSPGGAWEGMCGEGGQYTHHDGYQACNGNPAAAKSATDGAQLSVSTAGWGLGQVAQLLFPDATHFPHGEIHMDSSVLICGGECAPPAGFQGKTFEVNGEASPLKTWPPGAILLGPQLSVDVPYVSFAAAITDYSGTVSSLRSPRPTSTRQKFMLYVSSRCLGHRDAAAQAISSQVRAVDAGGACRPAGTNPISPGSGRTEVSWSNVPDMFTEYRFALVMENTATANYITEKPLNGFLGGTIPVYFGTTDVFKVFNKRAFIYYDIANPQLAIDRIAHLEKNNTAYAEVLGQPILANMALENYFSLSDDFGGGKLKRGILDKAGF